MLSNGNYPAITRPSQLDAPSIIDISERVRNWFKNSFLDSKQGKKFRNKLGQVYTDINWRDLKTESLPQYPPQLDDASESVDPGRLHSRILFTTVFDNATEERQIYSMKTERSTKTVFRVTTESALVLGDEISLTLATPQKIVKMDAKFRTEYTMKSGKENTVEEELRWTADTQVTVPPHTKATAELLIKEFVCEGDFDAFTSMQGVLVATLRNRKKDDAIITVIEADIYNIINDMFDERKLDRSLLDNGNNNGPITLKDHVVRIRTRNHLKFVHAIHQEVKIV